MTISDATIREVAAVSKANREYEESKAREAARIRAMAEKIADDAFYAYSCGVPLRGAIVGAAMIAIEDEGRGY